MTRATEPAEEAALPAQEPGHAGRGAAAPAAQGALDGGWVTARPTKLREVGGRIVRFPLLLREHADLVTTSVRRELEIRFRGTVLGWFWPLVQPLFLFAVYYFIFTKLLSFKIPDLPPGQEAAMGVYMFVGIMGWSAISESLTRGTGVIVDNGNLIKKLSFPSEILPLNVSLVGTITMLFALVVFVLATLLTPIWTAPGPELAWAPVLVLVQTVFAYGLVLLTSTLQVFLRDTIQLVGILTTVWMFATPIFWVPEMLPGVEPYLPMIQANPVYHLVMAWRAVLMGDLVVQTPAGPLHAIDTAAIPGHIAVFALWAAGAFVVGYTVFVLSQRRFADEV